jgi:hypothetical protein
MKATPVFAAVLLVAGSISAPAFLAGSARAADLYGENYVEPPYDEPGYSDNGYENGYSENEYSERSYAPRDAYDARDGGYRAADRYEPAEPLPGSIKDGYPVPVPAPGYSDNRRQERVQERVYERVERRVDRRARHACLERWEIRRRLADQGWAGIRPMGGADGIVNITARRFDSSSRFLLRVDRCSGEVLAARPDRYLRSFAYRDNRWR